MTKPFPSVENQFDGAHVRLLLTSYQRLVGQSLLNLEAADTELGQQAFEAEFVLASHDTADNPLFNYGNRQALTLFEFSWDEFIGLPSAYSAEAENREKRIQLLEQVTRQGFVEGYSGVRISESGRRFLIRDAVVWNVTDEAGAYHGQAVYFSKWDYLN